MISEKMFIRNYSGFWSALFPLQKTFIKGVILESSQNQCERELRITGRRFSFVSEVGFQMYSKCFYERIDVNSVKYNSALHNSIEELCKQKFKLFGDDDDTICDSLSETEFGDSQKIAYILENKFCNRRVLMSPMFCGCGIIDTCYGDIIADDILFEIKAVNRNFNMMDFKQLVTYCSLNHITKTHVINSIGLFNPKKNMSYVISLDLFAATIAGTKINDVYWNVIHFISQDESSK